MLYTGNHLPVAGSKDSAVCNFISFFKWKNRHFSGEIPLHYICIFNSGKRRPVVLHVVCMGISLQWKVVPLMNSGHFNRMCSKNSDMFDRTAFGGAVPRLQSQHRLVAPKSSFFNRRIFIFNGKIFILFSTKTHPQRWSGRSELCWYKDHQS